MKELQELYNSEINFSIKTMWDAGFTVGIGDDYNGYGLTEATYPTLIEAVTYLTALATKMYPDSAFANRHTSRQTEGDV